MPLNARPAIRSFHQFQRAMTRDLPSASKYVLRQERRIRSLVPPSARKSRRGSG